MTLPLADTVAADPHQRARFPNKLRQFRERHGVSQSQLAETLGVRKVTVLRWENGSARPSHLAAAKLVELGFQDLRPEDTNLDEVPRLKRMREPSLWPESYSDGTATPQPQLRRTFSSHQVNFAPYVENGPENQLPFFDRLFELQAEPIRRSGLPVEVQAERLSVVRSVEGLVELTSQAALEQAKETATHWSANYGPHGWHRYIGRFPPHLVRALLNHFGATDQTTVLDPFSGSGTTVLECRLLGIPARGVEICPLSALISRVKGGFRADAKFYRGLANDYVASYDKALKAAIAGRTAKQLLATEVAAKSRSLLPAFSNCDKWLTGEAALGVALTLEFAEALSERGRDSVLVALSSKMRSIGNVDVDVARAEYRKTPRENVDVQRLVAAALRAMAEDVGVVSSSHHSLGKMDSIQVQESDILHATLDRNSIDHVITSPPYGVESSSYLRSHLLSYRCLNHFLKVDPYDFGHKAIGSEYLRDDLTAEPDQRTSSDTCRRFFADYLGTEPGTGLKKRAYMMLQFFADMERVADVLHRAMRKRGCLALVVGNKRLGDSVIPTDAILTESLEHVGFSRYGVVAHKLKCNNSNSQVPWQERVIQDEFVLLFQRR